MSTLSDFLTHPIETLESALHIRKQIAQLQKELGTLFGAHPPAIAELQHIEPRRKGRRKMSAEARARIAAAQRARWAKQRESKPVEPAAPTPATETRKGAMSAAGRSRIAAAQKARWAKLMAEKSTPAAAPVKAKRKISAAHRAKLAAAAKARWAKVKKAKG